MQVERDDITLCGLAALNNTEIDAEVSKSTVNVLGGHMSRPVIISISDCHDSTTESAATADPVSVLASYDPRCSCGKPCHSNMTGCSARILDRNDIVSLRPTAQYSLSLSVCLLVCACLCLSVCVCFCLSVSAIVSLTQD